MPENKFHRNHSKVPGLPHDDDIDSMAHNLRLPPTERAFLRIIRKPMNVHRRYCFYGQERLAYMMGLSKRQVRRVKDSLEEKGIISVTKRKTSYKKGSNNSNEYRFIYPWTDDSRPDTHFPSDTKSRPDTGDRADRTLVTEQTGHLRGADRTPMSYDKHKEDKQRDKQINQQEKTIDLLSISKNKTDQDELSQNEKGSSDSVSENKAGGKSRKGKNPIAEKREKLLFDIRKKRGEDCTLAAIKYTRKKRDIRYPKTGNGDAYENEVLDSILKDEQKEFEHYYKHIYRPEIIEEVGNMHVVDLEDSTVAQHRKEQEHKRLLRKRLYDAMLNSERGNVYYQFMGEAGLINPNTDDIDDVAFHRFLTHYSNTTKRHKLKPITNRKKLAAFLGDLLVNESFNKFMYEESKKAKEAPL